MRRVICALLTIVAIAVPALAPAQSDAKRSITKIAGDLYRFQNNFHYSVFLVTPEGVIATDPINAGAAKWLKDELAKRFNKTVKYLVYSHDHADHISGGEVFDDTAIVVSHENAKADIIAESRPTAVPELTFSDQMTIELGGKVVELTYVGPSHSDNMIVMNFPAERALFAVDFIPVKAVAWKTLSDAYIPEWREAIEMVEGMDFNILVPGHGGLGKPSDVVAFGDYMDELYEAVLKGVRAGKTLAQLQDEVRMVDYKDWFNYDKQLKLNIEGMFNQIGLHRRGN